MKDPINQVKSELSSALAARAGEPAKSPEEAATHIERLRSDMTTDLASLRARLPDPSEIAGRARRMGALIGGGVAALGVAGFAVQRRSGRRSQDTEVQTQARALAEALAQIELEAEQGAPQQESGRGGRIAVAVALVAAVAGIVVGIRQRMQGDDDVWDTGEAAEPDATPDGAEPASTAPMSRRDIAASGAPTDPTT